MSDCAIAPGRARRPTLSESCLSFILRAIPIKHGGHRILDRLKPTKWAAPSGLVEFAFNGHKVQMDISDLVGWHFFIMKHFDPEVTEIIERFSAGDSTDVFWDIGANKGACSYEIATALPLSKIVAIEPQQEMTGLLEKNLAVLAPGRHEVLSVGIGETAGRFNIIVPSGNRGRASLIHKERGGQTFTEAVQIITGEDIARQSRFGWPTLVKIDVEGFEPSVMRSLEPAFVTGKVRCCVFERHPTDDDDFGGIISNIERYGYRVYAIRKNAFSTWLVSSPTILPGSTDYAIVRNDLC